MEITVQFGGQPLTFELGANTALALRIEEAVGRAALYGITDPVEARLFVGVGIELDFAAGVYRRGFTLYSGPNVPGWSFTRASVGWAENAGGTPEAFASGEPRITTAGLLIEPERTNLLLHSGDFDQSAWTKTAAGTGITPVVNTGAVTAPDGTSTADEVVFDLDGGTGDTNNRSMLTQTVTVANATPHAMSIWLRSDTPCTLLLLGPAGTDYEQLSVTADWQKFDLVETTASTSAAFQIGLRGSYGPTDQATVEMWGAQIEAGQYATSTIETAGTTATREADDAVLEQLLFQQGCTILADLSFLGGSSAHPENRVAMALTGNTSADRVAVVNLADGVRAVVEVNSATEAISDTTGASEHGEVQRIAVRVKADDVRQVRNGSLGLWDASADVPVLYSKLGFGSYPSGTAHGGVVIRRVVVLPQMLDDSALRVLTGGDPIPEGGGETWTQVVGTAAFPRRDSARTFKFGGLQFIGNGYQEGSVPVKDLWSSPDGLSYTQVNGSPPYEDWSALIALGSSIYAIGATEMWESTDGGTNFTKIVDPMPFGIVTDSPVIVTSEGKLLAFPGSGETVDAGNGVWEFDPSDDSWTQVYTAAWGGRSYPKACEFGGYLWLYGGHRHAANVPAEPYHAGWTTLNDLWRGSLDGTAWTQVSAGLPCSPRLWPFMIGFNDRLLFGAGYNSLSATASNFTDLWEIEIGTAGAYEGMTRIEVQQEYIERHAAVEYVFNGRLYLASGNANLAGGTLRDIWQLSE